MYFSFQKLSATSTGYPLQNPCASWGYGRPDPPVSVPSLQGRVHADGVTDPKTPEFSPMGHPFQPAPSLKASGSLIALGFYIFTSTSILLNKKINTLTAGATCFCFASAFYCHGAWIPVIVQVKLASFGCVLLKSVGKCSGDDTSSEQQWGTAGTKGPRMKRVAARGCADQTLCSHPSGLLCG